LYTSCIPIVNSSTGPVLGLSLSGKCRRSTIVGTMNCKCINLSDCSKHLRRSKICSVEATDAVKENSQHSSSNRVRNHAWQTAHSCSKPTAISKDMARNAVRTLHIRHVKSRPLRARVYQVRCSTSDQGFKRIQMAHQRQGMSIVVKYPHQACRGEVGNADHEI
jgi:hypothetical protein